MDKDSKIININEIVKENSNKETDKNIKKSVLHTNPIIQKIFLATVNNKKDKFSFKDLFW